MTFCARSMSLIYHERDDLGDARSHSVGDAPRRLESEHAHGHQPTCAISLMPTRRLLRSVALPEGERDKDAPSEDRGTGAGNADACRNLRIADKCVPRKRTMGARDCNRSALAYPIR
jgi:hypothetical protein